MVVSSLENLFFLEKSRIETGKPLLRKRAQEANVGVFDNVSRNGTGLIHGGTDLNTAENGQDR